MRLTHLIPFNSKPAAAHLLLEIVPEGEVAQHFKECVVTSCHAHVLNVIGAHTFLGGSSAGHLAWGLCTESVRASCWAVVGMCAEHA
eukprot:1160088-Pelagomonas_calceolata.AAC.18